MMSLADRLHSLCVEKRAHMNFRSDVRSGSDYEAGMDEVLREIEALLPTPDLNFNGPQCAAKEALVPGRFGSTLVLNWYRGVGTSSFLRKTWLRFQPARVVHVVPSVPDWWAMHGEEIGHDVRTTWIGLGGKVNKRRSRVDFRDGGWVLVLDASSPPARCAGLRADILSFEDAQDLPVETYHVRLPLLSDPRDMQMCIVAGKWSRDKRGSLLDVAMKNPHAMVLTANYRDVPEQVSPAYVEAVRAVTSPEVWASEWEGEEPS